MYLKKRLNLNTSNLYLSERSAHIYKNNLAQKIFLFVKLEWTIDTHIQAQNHLVEDALQVGCEIKEQRLKASNKPRQTLLWESDIEAQ